eukprot:c13776_g1_i1.p1 GENE.c13776_g1_i1~~c13776_g1_i1.p1  ORF type:complete len:256 (-),score=88.55 c13776_g1_i1:42-761(-)
MTVLSNTKKTGFLNPESGCWRFLHVLNFLIGGTTFIAGTCCYYPQFEDYALAAYLYVIGSIGFLNVDLLEFATFFKDDAVLAFNISLSVIGSTFYVIGSAGFHPYFNLEDGSTSPIGIWGFILGSFFIGASQFWKVHRIGSQSAESADPYTHLEDGGRQTKTQGFHFANLFNGKDNFSGLCVELNAGIGGWCFFVGTLMYNYGDVANQFFLILGIWVAGSVFFTLGALSLGVRHFILDM